MASQIVFFALLAIITCSIVLADNAPLQDFCVAEMNSSVRVNGLACKDPKLVRADDFFFSGLHIAGNTSNAFGSKVTQVSATQLPGLNTLGVSMVRIDFAPWGVNPPHTHPRASEILTVLEGTLEVGFITSNPDNKLITKVLQKGDAWVFPEGLIHYQRNVGNCNAVVIAGFSSQAPGVIGIGNAVFGSDLLIPTDLLAKSFQTHEKVIEMLKSKFKKN